MNAFTSCTRISKGFAAAFAVGFAIASTHAQAGMTDQHIRVINHTDQPIIAVLVSHENDDDFGSNRLNMPALLPGSSVTINPFDGDFGCVYNLMAVLKDRSYFTQQVDVCPMTREVAFWY